MPKKKTSQPPIPVLDLTPSGAIGRQPLYRFATSYPWVTTTGPVRITPEEAFVDAQAWIVDYIKGASWARMGTAIGVTRRDGGYVGVVNYYHSNS